MSSLQRPPSIPSAGSNPWRFRDRNVGSVVGLMRQLKKDAQAVDVPVWYRGLRDLKHELVPTLHRTDGIPVSDERNLMDRFKQNAHQFLDHRPQGEWEWLFLMRHHGALSRLLDWTESPLVGAHFALGEKSDKDDQDGVLWCLLPTALDQLANPVMERPDLIPMFTDGAETSRADEEFLNNYLTSAIRESEPAVFPAAGISTRLDTRIQAQLGVFTIHHASRTPLESIGDRKHLWRYIIPSNRKASFRAEFRLLRFGQLTISPDLDSVATEARRQVDPNWGR